MFWDGDRWVDEPTPVGKDVVRPARATPTRLLAMGLAVIVILPMLLIPALGIVSIQADLAADTGSIKVQVVGDPTAGGYFRLVGKSLKAGTMIQVRLDRSSSRLRFITVNRSGKFVARVKIPATVTPGVHRLEISQVNVTAARRLIASSGPRRSLAGSTIVSLDITVAPFLDRSGQFGSHPTSKPNPVASPTPSAAPTPTPEPTPDGLSVPASIDATGSRDVSAALNAFIKSVPDGSRIDFKAGATYRLDQAIILRNRHDLVFDGNGASLRIGGCFWNDSAFKLDSDDRITIRQFKIVGDNSGGGTASSYEAGCEFEAGVALYHVTNVEVSDILVSNVWGDCLYVDQTGGAWSDGVWFHDSTCQLNGRQGVAIVAGRHVTIERVAFDRLSRHVLDIEADDATGGGTDVIFRNNTVSNYGTSRVNVNTWYLFSASGSPGSVVRNVTVTGNTVTGGTLSTNVKIGRRKNIVMTNNTSLVPAHGPVLIFEDVDGITITGNRQPLLSGTLVLFPGCTGVVYH